MTCTIVIAHRDTPEWLDVVTRTWRFLEPHTPILVIDTASADAASFELLKVLATEPNITVADLGYTHQVSGSDQVSAAFDYAFSAVDTEYILSTHTDVFPLRRDALRDILQRCGPSSPVVGWEMSPRGNLKLPSEKRVLGAGIPGHAFTVYHVPTVRSVASTWCIRAGGVKFGLPRKSTRQVPGWPDTETAFGFSMRASKIPMQFLGQETNDAKQETAWWVHARSRTIRAVFGQKLPDSHHHVLQEAKQRLAAWIREEAV